MLVMVSIIPDKVVSCKSLPWGQPRALTDGSFGSVQSSSVSRRLVLYDVCVTVLKLQLSLFEIPYI